MNLTPNLRRPIDRYLSSMSDALRTRPESERAELLRQMETHILDALRQRAGDAPSEADIEAVLAGLDAPEYFAAADPAAPAGAPAASGGRGGGRWFALALAFLVLNGWAVWQWMQNMRASAARDAAPCIVWFSAADGADLTGATPLAWRFNRDMVASGDVGRPLPEGAVTLAPALAGDWRWRTARELEFAPQKPWPLANDFTVTFTDALRDAAGRPLEGSRSYVVRTPALALLGIEQANITPDRSVVVQFNFNAPPEKEALAKALSLSLPDGSEVSFQSVAQNEGSTNAVFQTGPVMADELGVTIQAGIPPWHGTRPLAAAVTNRLAIRAEMQLRKLQARSAAFEPCELNAYFTATPDLTRAAAFIRVEPEVAFAVGELDSWEGGGLTLTGGFEPGKTYRVTFRAGLPSPEGLTLPQEIVRHVQFPSRQPALTFASNGRYLSPRGGLRIPITTVNVRSVILSCRPVRANNLVYLAQREESWSGWNEAGEAAAAAEPLSSAAVTVTNDLPSAPNRPAECRADLRSLSGGAPLGAYLLCARAENVGARSQLVVVTDLGLSARLAADGALVWVNSLREANPVADAEVVVWARNNQELARGRTDAQGLAYLKWDRRREDAPPFLVTAAQGGDLSYLPLRGQVADGDTSGDREYTADGREAYVFTDRGIYRPGETVHLQALVRERDLTAPAQVFPALFRITRPDGRVYKDFPVMLDELGAASADVTLPDYLPTGSYGCALVLPGTFAELGATWVALEDFVPPQIVVNIEAPEGRRPARDDFTFQVSARHLFGRAASGLTVNGAVTVKPVDFKPVRWPEYVFGDPDKSFSPVYTDVGRGSLDERGTAEFTVKPGRNGAFRPPAALQAVVAGTVFEAGGRAVTSYATVNLDAYPYYIGLRADDGNNRKVGEPARFAVVAVKPDGEPFQPSAPLRYTLARAEWTTVLKREGDGRYRYVSDRRLKTVKEGTLALQDGRGEVAVTPPRAGDFQLTVRAGDDSDVSTRWTFFASTPDQDWVQWSKGNPERVELSLDRTSYAPGETAKLALRAPFTGVALVTVESDRVLLTRMLKLERNTAELELPVDASWLPAARCTVTILRPAIAETVWSAHRAVGGVPVPINLPDRRLNVALEAPATMRPQNKLPVTLRVTDAAGRPVAGDAVVAAVDEGICLLTQFAAPDPLAFFLALRRPGVSLFDLYADLMPEIVEDEAGGPASHTAGGEGTNLALRRRLNPIRANRFKPVALWQGRLALDTNGVTQAVLDVPEFTGRLRLMAVAYNRAQAGAAQGGVEVKRPLVVQPALPRFLAPGDRARCGVVIFNETGADQTIRVRVAAGGPLSVEQPERSVPMKAGEQRTEYLEVAAGPMPGKGILALDVSAGNEAYREDIEIAVRPAAPLGVDGRFGVVKAGQTQPLQPPVGWLPESLSLSAFVSGRPDAKLTPALEEVLRYPYGCVEQTASAMFPLLYLDDLVNRAQPNRLGREETGAYLRAGFYRLLSMQQANGGFAMWPYSREVWPWGSIYATHYLVEARRAERPEVTATSDRLEAALNYLRSRLDAPGVQNADPTNAVWQVEQEERAYICQVLALAGQPEHGWTARLKERADRLSVAARVHLAAALMHGGQPAEAGPILASLGLPETAGERGLGGIPQSRVRDAALLLSAWLDLDPQNAAVPQLVRRLEELQTRGHWLTTQDNAMALLALGKYAARVPPDPRPCRGSLSAGEASLAFDSENPLRWTSPEPGAPGPWAVRNDGPADAYYSVRWEGVPAAGKAEEGDWGLKIRREVFNLQGEPISATTLRQGDLIVVRLTVEPDGRETDNVAIEELLPAGLEIENPALATSQQTPWIKNETAWCRHRDIRDDRLILFTGPMSERGVYHYAARAVTPGVFVWPAASAAAMYDPGIRSVRGATTVEVCP